MSKTPTLGRTLLVRVPEQANNGADTAPADIVHVWPDGSVNLKIHTNAAADIWATEVPVHDTEDEARKYGDSIFSAWWPEIVSPMEALNDPDGTSSETVDPGTDLE